MKVNVLGAGGYARQIIPVLLQSGFQIVGIYDSSYERREEIYPGQFLIGNETELDKNTPTVLAIGDNQKRQKAFVLFNTHNESLMHKTSHCDSSAILGRSNMILGNSFIGSCVKIGDNNIINTGAIIEHESIIGNHTHISINAALGGRTEIGDFCFIGASATIIDKVKITGNVIVGAGAVVVKDITEPGTYAGVPAKKIS